MNPHAPQSAPQSVSSPFRLPRASMWLAALGVLALATCARAWDSPAESLVAVSPDPRTLRAALESLARESHESDPRLASEALYWRGVSAVREGLADTAIASFQRAAGLFSFEDEQLARADAWIARGHKGDLENAAGLMFRAAPFADVTEDHAPFRARLAWSLFLTGKADSALSVFRPVSRFLQKDLVWRERMGRAAEAANSGRLATDILLPVVIETRGADKPALDALHRSLGPNQEKRVAELDAYLRQKVAEREAADRVTIEGLGGHRLRVNASDGFSLGAALFVPGPRSPVAVVMMSTGDSLPLYDSLVTRMGQAGLAVLLLERRGSGASIGTGAALASDFYGREEAVENRIARDAVDALRAAAKFAPLDTTRITVVGVHDGVTTAVRAATLLPRARALLLISPIPTLIELGPAHARLEKLNRPVFIQLAMDEGYMFHSSDIYMDALYRGGDASRSRIVEARLLGGGPTLFRRDPTLWPRIEEWLHSALSAPTSTR